MQFDQLTAREREALAKAVRQGVNPKDKSISQPALKRLIDLELVVMSRNRKGRPLWRPSATGMAVYATRGLRATYLHAQSQYGYTRNPSRAMRHEPETMDDDALERYGAGS